jgi:hypothetical protein
LSESEFSESIQYDFLLLLFECELIAKKYFSNSNHAIKILKTPENFFAYNKINDLCEYAPPKIND